MRVKAPRWPAALAVAPAEKEERDEDDEFGGQGKHGGFNGPGAWTR